MWKWARYAVIGASFLVSVLTLPQTKNDIRPGVHGWREWLADYGGGALQYAVFFSAITVMLVAYFAPKLAPRHEYVGEPSPVGGDRGARSGEDVPRSIEAHDDRIFDEAPPELANMTPASLKATFANRTEAQRDALMEQHVGKPVRISGEVVGVQLGTVVPLVSLKSKIALHLFFDPTEDYDPKPALLALNKGERIDVSGKIHKFGEKSLSVDHCRLINARGRLS